MRYEIALLILGMGIVTFLPRFLPMAVLSRQAIPDRVKRGLDHFPISLLSAIVFPILFFNGEGEMEVQLQFLLSALPVFLFAWRVKSLWGSVLIGMAVYWGLGFII